MLRKLITFLAFSLIVLVHLNLVFGREHPFCKNPSTDPEFNAKWLHNNTPDSGVFALLGNRVMRQHWSQFVLGRDVQPNEDYFHLCAKANFQVTKEKLFGDYKGYENLVADRDCTRQTNRGLNCLITSRTNPNYTDEATVYPFYVDRKDFHSYYIAVFCFKNGEIGWAGISVKKRRITDDDKAIILEQVESIGIDAEETVELYTDSCDDQ